MKTIKKLDWTVAVLVLCAGGRVLAAEAIFNYGNDLSIVGYANGGAGFEFTPNQSISVTSLGYSQTSPSSLSAYTSGTAQVSIWDSTGDLLSTAVLAETDPIFNQSYYQTVSPVTLTAGVSYFIGAVSAVGTVGTTNPPVELWAGNAVNDGSFSVSPDIKYLGVATGANIWEGLQSGTTTSLLVGPDFQYNVVPEPSALALAGLGGLSLLRLRRRK